MSRYIDVDVLENKMYHEAFENDASYNESNPMAKWDSGLWIRYKMFENTITYAPSIDIVRCKECAKRMRDDCPMCNGCKLDRVPTEDDDFCSYGEREGER